MRKRQLIGDAGATHDVRNELATFELVPGSLKI
jgi:hypothetical protein